VAYAAFTLPANATQAIDFLQEDPMNQMAFDAFVRRAATLLDRRSMFGGLSAVLLAASGIPHDTSAKKGKKKGKNRKSCKKRAGKCRQEFIENCSDNDVDDTPACENAINNCCKKAAKCKVKDLDKLFDQCGDVLCEFKSSC
jgi:hypothetical protein